ncbi:MAG: hypothetical protein NZ750_11875 [Anaerolineae bacterium]|nr:hypothetical protein [Anaerolineae bacterium]MDW8173940.1 hypothetical protein [Anaerolineae bacterium]
MPDDAPPPPLASPNVPLAEPEQSADDHARFRPPALPPEGEALADLDSALASLRTQDALPDMDAALAALGSIDGLESLALDDAEAEAEDAPSSEPEADLAPNLAPVSPSTTTEALPTHEDGLITLERGQAASFVPSFLLMIGGGALTLWLSSGNTMPPWSFVLGVSLVGLGISLLAQWWSSGRWSEGNLFMGLLLCLSGGAGLFLEVSPSFDIANGYPLFILAAGLALLLHVALSATPRYGLAPFGLSLALAGLLALAYTLGNFSAQALEFAIQAAPFVLLLALAFMVLPMFVRRR